MAGGWTPNKRVKLGKKTGDTEGELIAIFKELQPTQRLRVAPYAFEESGRFKFRYSHLNQLVDNWPREFDPPTLPADIQSRLATDTAVQTGPVQSQSTVAGATKKQSGLQRATTSTTKNTDARDQNGISAARTTTEEDQAQSVAAVNTAQDKAHPTTGQDENTRMSTNKDSGQAAGSTFFLLPAVTTGLEALDTHCSSTRNVRLFTLQPRNLDDHEDFSVG